MLILRFSLTPSLTHPLSHTQDLFFSCHFSQIHTHTLSRPRFIMLTLSFPLLHPLSRSHHESLSRSLVLSLSVVALIQLTFRIWLDRFPVYGPRGPSGAQMQTCTVLLSPAASSRPFLLMSITASTALCASIYHCICCSHIPTKPHWDACPHSTVTSCSKSFLEASI